MGAGADQLQTIKPCVHTIAMQGCKFSGLDALANFDVPHTEFVHLFFVRGRGEFSKPDNTVYKKIIIIKLYELCDPSQCKRSDFILMVRTVERLLL
jgi:hypothetical protein